MSDRPSPFAAFRAGLAQQEPLRTEITSACRRPEPECLKPLLDLAAPAPAEAARAESIARGLVVKLRAKMRERGVEGMIHEYSLSSQEGVALMRLAEALLRIPDATTRDLLIRDKLSSADWRTHLGHSPSMFVNAATWGLVLTGRLVAPPREQSLTAALTGLIARRGEPIIRRAVDVAMRMLGAQFVSGRTIAEAVANSRAMEARGFTYSYDMLGEAATTAEDASRYLSQYAAAVRAIGETSRGRGIYERAGVSVKLSALHPRFSRSQRDRVMTELLPRVKILAELAKRADIGFNIDAEEADKVDISLDILEALSLDPALAGWNGLGFAVQAYGKRCPYIIDWLIDLARRSQRRLMIRLVKGAYWDAEIKRAQVDGLDGFPVFTRKIYSDVSFLACARKMLAAPDAIYPQFATHNAQSLAAVLVAAGPSFYPGQFEFQCLHGMGEQLYEEVVGPDKLNRPCRIYAPVGSHETLLAYLVRRLLENGANSSFVNRIADRAVALDELVRDPVAVARAIAPPGAPHGKIAAPRDLFGADRRNSFGIDLADERRLAALADGLDDSLRAVWTAFCRDAGPGPDDTPVVNPANRHDLVGMTRPATLVEIGAAMDMAARAAAGWAATLPCERAAVLQRAADAIEARADILIGLIVREAGKTFANAVAEVREAVDFLRYYACEAVRTLDPAAHAPLGPVVCISPWNFPLSIFMGQVAAALAAGNVVLAKPAEETPLIAAEAVRILHDAGAPENTVQLLPGAGDVGAALVADPRAEGVIFTGSTAVGRLIQGQLAGRLGAAGKPVPLIAETGGLNALVVDSTALAEQVAADAISSAFDSAGQRCSALRILCLQEEIADRTLGMLIGAMSELEVGVPDDLSVDVGPVIAADARDGILSHIETMRSRGHRVWQLALKEATAHGTFVAPTIIEVSRIGDVEREIFGPVLHVMRYRREELDELIADINAAGYGLTFGLHTRIDGTVARVVEEIEAGNIYINRNIIGAVVGVQPFGGARLSGVGPKAGGPLYLGRLVRRAPRNALAGARSGGVPLAGARAYVDWLRARGHLAEAETCAGYIARSPSGARIELAGPVGERNIYALRARGRIAALAAGQSALLVQVGAILATGNTALVASGAAISVFDRLPQEAAARIIAIDDPLAASGLAGVLFEGPADDMRAAALALAARAGPIVPMQAVVAPGDEYELAWLVDERSIAANTAAAGGDAGLMSMV